jgi:hypothetical protein
LGEKTIYLLRLKMASTEDAGDDSYSAKAIEMLGLTDLFDEARRMTKRQVRWFVPGVLVSGLLVAVLLM